MAEIEIPQVRGMSADERREALASVAMDSPERLKIWLAATGRRYIVLKSEDLVDGLPWPAGVEAFQQVVAAYRDHRRAIDSGRTQVVKGLQVPAMKDEDLEADELEDAILQLQAELARRRKAGQ